MKFALSILVYLLIAVLFCFGIVLLLAGKPLLFIVALVAYIVAFAKIGCMTH